MNDKNWLIRTKSNHILGPVSKAKVRELISSGSIKGDDEVCSGNGFWIYIRESDLINEYVLGDNKQGFNPVQEASRSTQRVLDSNENVAILEEDSSDVEDITLVGLTLDSIEQEKQEEEKKEEEKKPKTPQISTEGLSLELPEDEVTDSEPKEENLPKQEISSNTSEIEASKGAKKKIFDEGEVKAGGARKLNPAQSELAPELKKKSISIVYLYLIALVCLLFAVFAFIYKDVILDEINSQVSISIVPSAVAQTQTIEKKKDGIIF